MPSKSNKGYIAPFAVYLAAELALGILIHTADSGTSTYSYAAVVIAAIFSMLALGKSLRFIFNTVALAFTLGADYFLVVRGDNYPVAMVLFSVAQLAYAARIWWESGRIYRRVQLFVRGGVALLSVLLPFIVLGGGADFLAVVSVFYFGQLILNVVFAFVNIKHSGIMLPVGLLLFLFCDIFVGFGNLGGYLPIAEGGFVAWLAHPPINMAWVFYLPSQTMLGASLVFPLIVKRGGSVNKD